MAEMSRRFNEDEKFWEHVDEVLAENEQVMAAKVRPLRRPGEIGGVAVQPTLSPELPDPPEAA